MQLYISNQESSEILDSLPSFVTTTITGEERAVPKELVTLQKNPCCETSAEVKL